MAEVVKNDHTFKEKGYLDRYMSRALLIYPMLKQIWLCLILLIWLNLHLLFLLDNYLE